MIRDIYFVFLNLFNIISASYLSIGYKLSQAGLVNLLLALTYLLPITDDIPPLIPDSIISYFD